MMRYLSVCSGIEAATAAWHPLGWTPVAFSEVDAFPSAVLAHHYPTVPNWGDMTTFQEWPDATLDVLVGGTPCQSFSVAGLRKGMADPRGNLALTYLGLADRYRPTWVVWENVPGVLSSNGGRDFGAFLGGLAELGYGFAYRVLDAQYFGVAQRRRRVFVVGHLGDWRRAAAVLFERHSLQGHPAPRREKGQSAPTIPSRSTGGGGLGTDFDCDGGLIASLELGNQGSGGNVGWHHPDRAVRTLDTNCPPGVVFGLDVVPAMTTRTGTGTGTGGDGMDDYCVAHALRGEGFDASEDGTGRGTPLVPVAFDFQGSGKQTTLGASEDGTGALGTSKTPAIAIQGTVINRGQDAGPKDPGFDDTGAMFTLTKCDTHAGAQQSAVRRLTPRECERLQGFPDDYTAVPHRGKPAADGPRYKALGNSMAVPVMRWIGERIAEQEVIR